MLSPDRLTLAIDIHSRSYKLLRWVADAIGKGFIPVTRAHQYANSRDAALDWIEQHYWNFPAELRPDRLYLREFASFFATYVTSSFDVIERPGTRKVSSCGCYCPLCVQIVNAPFLQPKKLTKRDRERAIELMADRVTALAREEGIAADTQHVAAVVRGVQTRRQAAYSAYGHWLIERLDGHSAGRAVLSLWREIAWNSTGAPIAGFTLRYQDFIDAEDALLNALQAVINSG